VLGPIYSFMVPKDINNIYSAKVPPDGQTTSDNAPIPLITASISSDALTQNNPFAFRLRTLTSAQGNKSATYVRQILGLSSASIISVQGDTAYGGPVDTAFTTTFERQGGRVAHHLQLAQNVSAIVSTLAQDPNAGIVFLAMTDLQKARDVIVALRRNHVKAPILCSDAINSDLFPALFASYPEERSQPGYFTDGVYASAPVIYDSAPDAAQSFARQYLNAYKSVPGWFGAKYYEAAQVAVKALSDAQVQGTVASLKSDREHIVQQLANMDSPQTGVEGLDGQLYFNSGHNEGISQTRFGQFLHNRLRSLPLQLVAVSNPDLVDLPGQMRAGKIIRVDNQYFWKQRVVYAGIDLNTVSSIDVTNATFTADFYLWMRYSGDDDATAIAFTNARTVAFDPTQPQISQIINDPTLPQANQPGSGQRLHYRIYHVTGDFKATYDSHQYPFDQQQLNLGFQNTRLTSDSLVYAIDALGLRLNNDNSADPQKVAPAFQSLSTWTYQGTQYASDTFSSRSTLGDPRLFDQQQTRTDYSGLQVTMTVQRKALAYLVSHLLPLILLILLVYASLFLSLKHLGDRLTLTASALLASAVLLLSVNSELPDIGYVVSLDYIYYIFFGLCLLCTVVPMFMEWLHEQKRVATARYLNIGLHIVYLATVAATVTYYIATYGNRLA
jgi:branched-chain amino acid transport system substrate-binding protein